MIPLDTVRHLYEYNYWARDQQLEACRTLSPDQFLRPLGSSFSSLRDTLAHLIAAEWIWHERWRGRSPRSLLRPEEFPTLEAVRERWTAVEQDIRDFLNGLRDDDLPRPLTYTNTKGQSFSYPLWHVLFHVVNHQTYHRGQVTTLLRQLGAPAVSVDFLVAKDLGLGK